MIISQGQYQNTNGHMQQTYRRRIKKILKKLAAEPCSSCLVLTSNPAARRSLDTNYPYRQNSDIFYLTGSLRHDISLVLRPNTSEPITLIIPPDDKIKNLWEGTPPNMGPIAEGLNARLVRSTSVAETVFKMLRGFDSVFLPTNSSPLATKLRNHLSSLPSHEKRALPSTVIDAEPLLSVLRSIKTPQEIAKIKRATALTSAVLYHISQAIEPGMTEHEVATLIDYLYRLHGAEPAFNTIVAAGKSAATLHYQPGERCLKAGEFVLIDSGCELDMYSSDITRTIPIGESLPEPLRDVYEIVLSSQKAAIKRVKPGVTLRTIHNAAAKEITLGLKSLGILKGSTDKLLREAAYHPWFPHGIGHSLGIDVHDPTPFQDHTNFILEPGMVITIEPGLYFPKRAGKVSACGIRIEDDVLVTKQGHQILSQDVFPKELSELALLLG
jgi:Xaa-Pro aminopeptidase